ncbi:hypothetical protein H7I00_13805, partial [Mycobacterium bohemicum]|nr:hypothetical protein [Mycobacterium bohemicum]
GQLRPVIGDLPLGGHFHNTRGTGSGPDPTRGSPGAGPGFGARGEPGFRS